MQSDLQLGGARSGLTGNDPFRFVWNKFQDVAHVFFSCASFRATVFNGQGNSDERLAICDVAIKNRALARLIGGSLVIEETT
jgi:hypothetical protein